MCVCVCVRERESVCVSTSLVFGVYVLHSMHYALAYAQHYLHLSEKNITEKTFAHKKFAQNFVKIFLACRLCLR